VEVQKSSEKLLKFGRLAIPFCGNLVGQFMHARRKDKVAEYMKACFEGVLLN